MNGCIFLFLATSTAWGFFRLSLWLFLNRTKKSPGTPSLKRVTILFALTYRPIVPNISFLERPKPQFAIFFKHSAIFFSCSIGIILGRSNDLLFTPLCPFTIYTIQKYRQSVTLYDISVYTTTVMTQWAMTPWYSSAVQRLVFAFLYFDFAITSI